MRKDVKDWTILIYANGNNELEPEMWQSKIDAEKVGSKDNINVIMQIGRETRELVKIIRQKDNIPFTNERWTGVRRYYVLKDKSKLIEDLGSINMADPHILYNFIAWGTKSYPAKRYMLILSGHGGSLTAALPDLSQDIPYAMGVTEMCKVLNMIKTDTGSNIDILVLDICYMNSIEVLYELGKNKINTVKNILTYINNGPICGMPYDKIIRSVEKNSLLNTEIILKEIIEGIQLDLISIKLDLGKLKLVKKLVNEMGYIYLSDERYKRKEISSLPYLDKESILYKDYMNLNKEMNSMIIYYKKVSKISSGLINLTKNKFRNKEHLNVCYKLSFFKNNYWTYIISNKSIGDTLDITLYENLLPSVIRREGLISLIRVMNPGLSEEEANYILKKVYEYKNWNKINDEYSLWQ